MYLRDPLTSRKKLNTHVRSAPKKRTLLISNVLCSPRAIDRREMSIYEDILSGTSICLSKLRVLTTADSPRESDVRVFTSSFRK